MIAVLCQRKRWDTSRDSLVGIRTGKPPGVRGHTRTRARQKPVPAVRVRVFLWVSTFRPYDTRTPGGFTRR